MRILCYEHSGFCSGVQRAVDIALELVKEGKDVYTLGPLVHNEEVEKYLSSKGVKMVSSLEDVKEGDLIIRTHGEGPEELKKAAQIPGVTLHDATCPRVKKVQSLAQELTEQGYQVVIWGKPEHPEVDAILKWTQNKAIVVSSMQDLARKKIRAPSALISQTTQERLGFENAARRYRELHRDCKVYDTLCPTVKRLQDAAEKMASKVDLMIIIGSPISSNTEKLLRLCIRKTPTYRVSSAKEISTELFRDVKLVGIIAGASTPGWIIKEVLNEMSKINSEKKSDLDQNELAPLEEKEMSAKGTDDNLGEPEVTTEASEELSAAEEPVKGQSAAEPEEGAAEENDDKSVAEDQPEAEKAEKSGEAAETEDDIQDFYFLDEIKVYQNGDIATGTVVSIQEDSVMIDMGDKMEAILPGGEVFLYEGETLENKYAPGDKLEVLVINVDDQEGEVLVSHRRLERRRLWEKLEKASTEEETLTGKVKEVVPKGMIVDLGAGINGFVPGSLVDIRYVPDFNAYLGQEISFKVIELDQEKDKVILSRKKYVEEANAAKKEETLKILKPDIVVTGEVRRLTKFGAFVDLGGIDGLVHISEISWRRIKHPEEALKIGDKVKVKVLQVNPEEEKVSLSIRRTGQDPWEQVTRRFKIGEIIEGKVTRLVDFGAFVEIIPGVEGLVHVSQIADHHVKHPSEALSEGATVQVKIIDLRPEDKRISLSIKDANPVSHENANISTGQDNGSGVTLGDVFGDLFENEKK